MPSTHAPRAPDPAQLATGAAVRFDTVDAVRGLAMVWMTVFHFCFNLNEWHYIQQDLKTDAFWTLQRTAIVSLFLLCAGVGQAIAMHQNQSSARFWRRWFQITVCAGFVTLGSMWMFPNSFIYFGVLHAIALMLLLVRFVVGPLALRPRILVVAATLIFALFFVAPYAIAACSMADFFNAKWVNWLGLITVKPFTEDYVPLAPWLAVMLLGLALGNYLLTAKASWLNVPLPRGFAPLGLLGRWSLSYYMLHQPVMIGALMLWSKWQS
jgi:uncharacterized membrane protein